MPTLAAGLSIGEYARSLERRLASSPAVLLAVIWALSARATSGPRGHGWGSAWLVLVDCAAGWAWRRPPGAVRRVACVWAGIGVAAVIVMATWLLTYLLAGVGGVLARHGRCSGSRPQEAPTR